MKASQVGMWDVSRVGHSKNTQKIDQPIINRPLIVQEIIESYSPNLLLAFGGITVDKRGESLCPQVIKNPSEKDGNIPQAWIENDQWLYNGLWMLAEKKYLNREVLGDTQKHIFFNSIIEWVIDANMQITIINQIINGGKFTHKLPNNTLTENDTSIWWTNSQPPSIDRGICVTNNMGWPNWFFTISQNNDNSHGYGLLLVIK